MMLVSKKSSNIQAKIIFAICCLGFFLSLFFRMSTGVLTPDLVQDFGLSANELSGLSSAHSVAFGLAQIPVGIALDKYGAKKTMIFLAFVNLIGVILFAFGTHYYLLFISRVFMGIGTSAALMGTFVIVANWFSADKFATIAGICMSIGIAGQMVSSAPLAYLSNVLGWRMALVVSSIVLLAQFILMLLFLKNSPNISQVKKDDDQKQIEISYFELFKIKEFWYIAYIAFWTFGFMVSFISLWGGIHFMYALEFTKLEAGEILFFCSLGYLFGILIFSWLSDRLEVRAILLAPTFMIISVLFIVLTLLDKTTPLYIFKMFGIVFGFFMGTAPLIFTLIKEACPNGLEARGTTAINLIAMFGASVVVQLGGMVFAPDLNEINSPSSLSLFWWVSSASIFVAALAALRLVYLRKNQLKR